VPRLVRRMVGAAVLAIGATVAAARPHAQAVDPERIALAKTYLEVSKQVITTKQLAYIVTATLSQLNPDHKDQIAAAGTALIPRFESYDRHVSRVYAARFTAPELQSIIDFYKTPAGAKLATETPASLQESYQISAKWGARIAEDMRDAIGKALAQQGIAMKMPPSRPQ
jgi:uncharacterized protein